MKEKTIYSQKQQKFLNIELPRITIVEGCISSGKTYICNIKAVKHIIMNYQSSGLIFFVGRTLQTLKQNVLEPLMMILPEGTFKYSLGSKEAILFGIKINLEGCNDIRAEEKIRGSTAEFIYGDEVSLWNEPFFTRCLGSLRTPNACFLGTTNPGPLDNFLKEKFLDRKKELSILNPHFYFPDNPALTEDYIADVRREYTGILKRRFIDGEWCNAEGVIYLPAEQDCMDDYVITNLNKYLEENRLRITKNLFGIDYGPAGIGNSCINVLVLGGTISNYQEIIIVGEYLVNNRKLDPAKLQDKLSEFMKESIHEFGGAHAYADYAVAILTTGLQNRCIVDGIRCIVEDCVKHPIVERITFVNKLFAQNRIKILSNCKGTIEAFKTAVWSDENKQDERAKDIKKFDHNLIDAFEYSICRDTSNIETAGYLKQRY